MDRGLCGHGGERAAGLQAGLTVLSYPVLGAVAALVRLAGWMARAWASCIRIARRVPRLICGRLSQPTAEHISHANTAKYTAGRRRQLVAYWIGERCRHYP